MVSVLAWVLYPTSDCDGRLWLARFIAPLAAIIFFLVAISDAFQWVEGGDVGPPPVNWVVVGRMVALATSAMASAAMRRRKPGRWNTNLKMGQYGQVAARLGGE